MTSISSKENIIKFSKEQTLFILRVAKSQSKDKEWHKTKNRSEKWRKGLIQNSSFVGCLGEFAFGIFMNVKPDITVKKEGDKFDFAFKNKKEKIIKVDIKTQCREYYRGCNYQLPESFDKNYNYLKKNEKYHFTNLKTIEEKDIIVFASLVQPTTREMLNYIWEDENRIMKKTGFEYNIALWGCLSVKKILKECLTFNSPVDQKTKNICVLRSQLKSIKDFKTFKNKNCLVQVKG